MARKLFQHIFIAWLVSLMLLAFSGSLKVWAQSNDAATVTQQGPFNYVTSSQWLAPAGTPGFDASKSNYIFYVLPGMGAGSKPGHPQERANPLVPFSISCANNSQPLGTNKWWSQIGLQWSSTENNVQT